MIVRQRAATQLFQIAVSSYAQSLIQSSVEGITDCSIFSCATAFANGVVEGDGPPSHFNVTPRLTRPTMLRVLAIFDSGSSLSTRKLAS